MTARRLGRRPLPLALAVLVGTVASACAPRPLPSFEEGRAADHNLAGAEAFRRGELEVAAVHFERAAALTSAEGDDEAYTDALTNLGMIDEARGDDAAALRRFDEALARAEEHDYVEGAWSASLNRSRLLLRGGDAAAADAALDVAREAAESLDTRFARAAVRKQEGLVLRAAGRPADALSKAREALRLYQIGEESPEARAGRADAHLLVGRLLREGGDPVLAVGSFRSAAAVATGVPDPVLRARALGAAASTLEELGHLEDARLQYRAAFDAHRSAHDRDGAAGAARALLRIASAQHRKDRIEEAEALLAQVAAPADPEPERTDRSEIENGGGADGGSR